MGKRSSEPPDSSGRDSAHIQPPVGPDFDDEELPADERLDRILADADLLYRLQVSGYAPEEWKRLSEEFGHYGYDVFVGWIFNGKVWTKVHEKTGWHLQRPARPFTEEDVYTLAGDTVVASLDAFLEYVLKRNKWAPHGGASLKSYFIGQGCFQFPNALKAWRREQVPQFVRRPLLPAVPDSPGDGHVSGLGREPSLVVPDPLTIRAWENSRSCSDVAG